MKKLLLVLCLAAFSFSLSAQVYYLLPNSDDQNCEQVGSEYDNTRKENMLQWETCWLNEQDVPQCPERHAYEWLKFSYYNDAKKVITYKDLTDGRLAHGGSLRDSVKVLWVNVDRWMTKADFDALFPQNVRTALADYVKDGGHLYLSTFAARLVWLMGRTAVEPGFAEQNGFGGCDINDQWKLKAHFIGEGYDIDMHTHAIYQYLNQSEGSYIDNYRYHMQKGVVRTDRNCVFDLFSLDAQNNFESANHAVVLAGWGHESAINCGGLIEFQPTGEWRGTIITNGLAACSFAAANEDVTYVQMLTKGVIDYLLTVEPAQEPQPEPGVLFSGSHHVTWDTPLDFEAAKFADAKAGDKIVVTYTGATDGIEFKVMNQYFDHLAGSREAAWINGNGVFEQFLTQSAVDSLKAYGLEIIGANFTCTKVELLDGKAELKDGYTVWTGYFWADEWTTLELFWNGYSAVDWNKATALRIYSEAGRTNYVINIKENWDEGGHIADKGQMTDGEGYAELALTEELRNRLANASHWMIQFNKEDGDPFNVTDIVLVMAEGEGFENTAVEGKAVKSFRNGQLVIEKNGKIYNVLGAQL